MTTKASLAPRRVSNPVDRIDVHREDVWVEADGRGSVESVASVELVESVVLEEWVAQAA